MSTAADITCYIQPITAECEGFGTAWVDTSKTAVFRQTVHSRSEADAALNEARRWAASFGAPVVLKKIIHTSRCADRAPARVKRLAGVERIA